MSQMREVRRDEAELEEERHFLETSLADLDAELAAGDMDAQDYLRLKDRYAGRLSALRRVVDAQRDPPTAAPPASAPSAASRHHAAARRRPWSKVVVATVVAGTAVAAGLLVASNLGQRLPGTTVTGAVQPTGPEAQLALAQQDLGNGKYLDAVKAYEAVLKQDPRNPEALAYRGWILFLTGRQAGDAALIDRGLTSVRAAEAADAAYADAHFFAGMIVMAKHDPAGAVTEFRLALANHPPSALVPEIQKVLQTAESQAAAVAPHAPTTPTTPTAPTTPTTAAP